MHGKGMNETRQSCGQVNPRTGASRSLAFRKIRLAVAAIDGGAKKLGVSGREMYERLDRQGLIHTLYGGFRGLSLEFPWF